MKQFYEPMAASGGTAEYAEPYYRSSNYIAQEKLDGERYILHYGEDKYGRIYSRRKSVESIRAGAPKPVDKTAQLQHLMAEMMTRFPPGTVLDGEVIAPGADRTGRPQATNSMLVSRVTGSLPDKALALQEELGFVEFACFDILAYGGNEVTDWTWKERMGLLEPLRVGPPPHVFLLPYTAGEPRKRMLYTKIVARGGEGVILKDITAQYYEAKRNKAFIKHKKEITLDVVFMGTEPAKEETYKNGVLDTKTKSKYAGQAGAIRFGQYMPVTKEPGTMLERIEMELVRLGTVSGFDDETRLDVTTNSETYARDQRVLEIRAQERLPSGSVRHPRFVRWRPDKAGADCIHRTDES